MNLIFLFSFLVVSLKASAIVKIAVSDPNKSPSVYIQFTGEDARKLWDYLVRVQKNSAAFIYEEGGMSKAYLSTPVLTCSKISKDVYDKGVSDKAPRLYDCFVNLSNNGLAVVP